jgi:hypothetical protein
MLMHDHTPHHGGVVAMVGMTHLEALAAADGRVRVYLSDRWRRPLPLVGVSGSVTLRLPDGKHTVPLAEAGDFLEAQGPRLPRSEVSAHIEIARAGESIDMNFQLPLAGGAAGAAGVPAEGCVPPQGSGGGRPPRCIITFPNGVSAMAAAPAGACAVIAVVNLGLSAWRLPRGELLSGFAAAPAVAVSSAEPAHPEAPNDIAVRPDGLEAAVAVEGRLLRYEVSSGRFLKELRGPGGVVRALAWSPDGTRLLVTAFYDDSAHLLQAEDGSEIRRFVAGPEATAVAFAADGRWVAVGSQAGSIGVFDPGADAPVRVVNAAAGPARALAFSGEHLLAAGDDGSLRIWDVRTGALLHTGPPGAPVVRLALDAERRFAATAHWDGSVRVHDLTRQTIAETLSWQRAPLFGLAWGGPSLVSGDARGQVALWDMPPEP